MNWDELRRLADDGLDAGSVRKIAHRHRLDLPHLPAVYATGMGRWEVHCQGCTLELGGIQHTCHRRLWKGPAVLYDVPLLGAWLETAQIELAKPA